MTASSSLLPAPNLMPLLRYRDLAEAMAWLEQAFGFERQIAVSDSDGAVIYGQMTYRGGLIMMGAVRDTELDKLMCQPDEVGGVETQSCYIVVDDADAHYARALESGADVVLELKSDGLGRRGYSCRDPEGHIWNFGTYNPGRGLSQTAAAPLPAPEPAPEPARGRPRLLMSLAALFILLGAAGWWFKDPIRADIVRRVAEAAGQPRAETERAYAELVKVRTEKRKADERAEMLGRDLEAERARRQTLEARSSGAADKLAEEEAARRAAEARIATLGEEVKRLQGALDAAVEAKRRAEEKLAVRSAVPPPAEPATAQAPAAPSGVSGIETSATGAARDAEQAQVPAAAPSAGGKEAAKEEDNAEARSRAESARETHPPRRTARAEPRRRPPAAAAQSSRLPPTYLVDMHDIPWPYNVWSR